MIGCEPNEQQAQRLRGEGEAEAIGIYADALARDPEFYAFTRRLQAYDTILKTGDRMIIPAETEFFRFLLNNSAEQPELLPMPAAVVP